MGKRDYQLTTSTMSCAPRLLRTYTSRPWLVKQSAAGTKMMILPLRAGSLGIRGAFKIFHHVFHRSTAARCEVSCDPHHESTTPGRTRDPGPAGSATNPLSRFQPTYAARTERSEDTGESSVIGTGHARDATRTAPRARAHRDPRGGRASSHHRAGGRTHRSQSSR